MQLSRYPSRTHKGNAEKIEFRYKVELNSQFPVENILLAYLKDSTKFEKRVFEISNEHRSFSL